MNNAGINSAVMPPPRLRTVTLCGCECARCRDPAQLTRRCTAHAAAQGGGCMPEQCAEPRREMAVARETCLERDGRQPGVGIEHRLERTRQPRAHCVLV